MRIALNAFDDRSEIQATKIAFLFGLLISANVLAWVWAWKLFAGQPALLGTALLAYLFGLRHAVDADHIAAIDNVVRNLMQEGKRPLSAGLFFSLGHSTIVILAAAALTFTAAAFQVEFGSLKVAGGVIGTAVSALFLLVIGFANLIIMRSLWAIFRRVRKGEYIDLEQANMSSGGGFIARMCAPLFRVISRSWYMYPLGFLFGLAFDTATEIGVLGLSAAQSANGVSIWSIMVFPALFTAGMALVDSTDSVVMVGAYGWAFFNPMRKLWYNITITAVSVVVALFIGSIEALGLIANKLGLEDGFWKTIADLNANLINFGFAVICIFVASWIISALIYRWNRYDELAVNPKAVPVQNGMPAHKPGVRSA
jgi:high-affinity nickel-transport protein